MSPALALLLLVPADPLDNPHRSMAGPAEAKTTAEVVAVAIKEDSKNFRKDEPGVETAEYNSRSLKAFVAWYNPYSGEDGTHVYLYVHDKKKGVWVRKLASVFWDTSGVSAEFKSSAVVLRNSKGEVIFTHLVE